MKPKQTKLHHILKTYHYSQPTYHSLKTNFKMKKEMKFETDTKRQNEEHSNKIPQPIVEANKTKAHKQIKPITKIKIKKLEKSLKSGILFAFSVNSIPVNVCILASTCLQLKCKESMDGNVDQKCKQN